MYIGTLDHLAVVPCIDLYGVINLSLAQPWGPPATQQCPLFLGFRVLRRMRPPSLPLPISGGAVEVGASSGEVCRGDGNGNSGEGCRRDRSLSAVISVRTEEFSIVVMGY